MAEPKRVATGWQVRYRNPEGKSRTKTFRLKEHADRFNADIAAAKYAGTYIESTGETFALVAQAWLASNPEKKRTTSTRDAMVIRVHCDPLIGRVKLTDLKPHHCKTVLKAMKSRGLAPKTIHTNMGVLRAVLNWGVETDRLVRTPYRDVNLPAVPPNRRRRADADDILRLVDAVPADYRVAIFLGAMGLRLAEVTGLRVGSIDFLRKTVTVQDTLNEVEGQWEPGDGKTRASWRTIALPPTVIDELAAHLARTGRNQPDDLVLTAPAGGPMRHTNFRGRIYNPALVRADLVGLNFHRLRHSAGFLMREAGAELEAIQKRLGHASIRTTADTYGSLPPRVDRAIAADLDRLFTQKPDTPHGYSVEAPRVKNVSSGSGGSASHDKHGL